jgi:hypothetical protein
LFSVKGDVPFGLTVSNIRLTALAKLNASDPTRPTLTSAQVGATATIGGNGQFSGVPVNLSATVANGAIVLGGDVVKTGFSWGGVSAQLTIHLQLKILPSQEQLEAQVGKTLDLSVAVQNSVLSVSGGLTVKLPQPVGKQGGSLALDLPFQFPSSRSFNDALMVLQPPLPRAWPARGAPDRSDGHAHPSTVSAADFAVARDALETGIATHLPYGTVLSIDTTTSTRKKGYGLENDSMIWSGHYLAAEAFRYAATGSADALTRVRTLLGGIKTNFDVTGDAVVMDGRVTPVPSIYSGVFARTSLPDNDALGYTDGDLNKRGGACYYERPAKGWRGAKGTYTTLAAALAHASKLARPTPIGPITYGFGCGDRGELDHPISRDQYLGLFMGLGYAYALIPDATIQAQIRTLVDSALDFLVMRNNWNVPLPPTGRVTTTFIGDIDTQLSLLRIGASVDPAKFGARYQSVAAAVELAWIPVWISTVDPVVAYFKFNLGHAGMGPAAYLETDPALKAGYLRSYRILAAATLTHRNAYFNLVDILIGSATASSPSASNPSMTRAAEITSDLADWLRSPFGTGVDAPRSARKASDPATRQSYACASTPPSAAQLSVCSSDGGSREGPGIDFLLPYWLGAYLKVLPN